MGMTNEEREKHIRIANMLIGVITDLERPMLMYQIEKDVTKEALENYIKMLEQQPCEDCISREQTLKAFAEKCGGECACCEYNGSGYDNAENCKLIKSIPSVTLKTYCESCREQVLKHLEKEDWADTVNCVMNMPFMKKEEIGVLDKIRAEIMQLDYDEENVDYDYNDMTQTEVVHMICREEVLRIINKYKAESEE